MHLSACSSSSLALVLVTATGLSGQSYDQLVKQFDYDSTAPLEYEQRRISAREGVTVYDVSYASPAGGHVPAYLVVPGGPGPFAGIVWQHGGAQYRTWFLTDAIRLAKDGAVSLLVDAPWNRPESMRGEPVEGDWVEQQRQGLIQVAIDARRGFDLLARRSDVDEDRIGYVGLSFGAMMGGVLAGVDKRFRTFVLVAGLVGFSHHYRDTQQPVDARWREATPEEEWARFLVTISSIDAEHYIGNSAPTPILFQSARYDIGVPEQKSQEFFEAAAEPKELKWYETGHMINDPQAVADRAAWLRRHLEF